MSFPSLRQPQSHTLQSPISTPNALLATAPEFLAIHILITTPRSLTQDDLQVALLGADPALNKIDRIGAECRVEGVLGLGVLDGLDGERERLVQRRDLVEHLRVGRDAGHGDAEGVVERDEHVVDGLLRSRRQAVVGCNIRLVDADGVRELVGRERGQVGEDQPGDVREGDEIPVVEELGCVSSWDFPRGRFFNIDVPPSIERHTGFSGCPHPLAGCWP